MLDDISRRYDACLEAEWDKHDEADREIRKLKKNNRHQAEEIEKSRAILGDKEAKLREVEKMCETLRKEEARALGDNNNLSLELTYLRQQLSEEKKRGGILKDKVWSLDLGLKELIKEKKDSSAQFRTVMKETSETLEAEKTTKASIADQIDRELIKSREKRSEMKKCLEEYRKQADEDTRQSKTSYSLVIAVFG